METRRSFAGVVVGVVQTRKVLERLENRPGDEMREGDLALVVRGAVFVDEAPVFYEEFDRDLALGGGGRNGKARCHVLGHPQRRAAERLRLLPFAQRAGHGRLGRRRGGGRWCGPLRRTSRRRRGLGFAERFAEKRPPLL